MNARETFGVVALTALPWFAMVPQYHPTQAANARIGLYWIVIVVVAGVIGYRTTHAFRVAALMTAVQLIAAVFSAPRGDGDGLWILWFPMLALFGLILLLSALAGASLRRRADARRSVS